MPLKVRVVLSPSGPSDPSRVAVGYDACDNTAPKGFTAIVNESSTDPERLGPVEHGGPDLTVQGRDLHRRWRRGHQPDECDRRP